MINIPTIHQWKHSLSIDKKNLYCCIKCNYHSRIGSNEYFEILFDKNKYTELDANMVSIDPLKFKDKISYTDRLKKIQSKTQTD